ncbi:MAG: hypothetical protein RL839_09305 [Gammaproteobacteria bacterium]
MSKAVLIFSVLLVLTATAELFATESNGASTQYGDSRREELVLKQHLEDLSTVAGPYGNAMIEAHDQYGQFLLKEERYEAAAEQFRQSWHLSRINFGLYSEEQLPHLNQLIEALSEMQRWEEVHDLHQLGFLVSSRIYPPDDLRYVLAAELYTAWQWEALTQNRLSSNSVSAIQSARELSELYQRILEKIENAIPGTSVHTLNLIVGKARTDLAIAQSVVQISRYGGSSGMGRAYSGARCRQDAYHAQRRNIACAQSGQVSFDPMAMNHPPLSLSLAGLYIQQVDAALTRLEEILNSDNGISRGERIWIENLSAALKAEAESLLQAGR